MTIHYSLSHIPANPLIAPGPLDCTTLNPLSLGRWCIMFLSDMIFSFFYSIDGKYANYFNWAPDEPSNDHENCVYLSNLHGAENAHEWNDESCSRVIIDTTPPMQIFAVCEAGNVNSREEGEGSIWLHKLWAPLVYVGLIWWVKRKRSLTSNVRNKCILRAFHLTKSTFWNTFNKESIFFNCIVFLL